MMKFNKTLMVILLLGCISVSTNGSAQWNKDDTVFAQSQTSLNNNNSINMKSNYSLAIITLIICMFTFSSVIGQEQISSDVQSYLDEMMALKKKLDTGVDFNKKEGQEAQYLKWAISKEDRDRFLRQSWINDTERKKLAEVLDAIGQAATKKGIGSKEEKKVDYTSNPAIMFTLNEISRITKEVDDFDPKNDAFIVNPSDGQWLLRAISKTEREKWATDYFKGNVGGKDEFWKRLDLLAASGTKKIPTFKPNQANFSTRNAEDEAMIKKKFDDISKIKIHQVGFANATWKIQKNALSVPEKRFKVGYVWGKDLRDDFNFCRLYQINIIQEYTGGGKYGESYAVLLESWIVGCP